MFDRQHKRRIRFIFYFFNSISPGKCLHTFKPVQFPASFVSALIVFFQVIYLILILFFYSGQSHLLHPTKKEPSQALTYSYYYFTTLKTTKSDNLKKFLSPQTLVLYGFLTSSKKYFKNFFTFLLTYLAWYDKLISVEGCKTSTPLKLKGKGVIEMQSRKTKQKKKKLSISELIKLAIAVASLIKVVLEIAKLFF